MFYDQHFKRAHCKWQLPRTYEAEHNGDRFVQVAELRHDGGYETVEGSQAEDGEEITGVHDQRIGSDAEYLRSWAHINGRYRV